jgi:hypothetical protein
MVSELIRKNLIEWKEIDMELDELRVKPIEQKVDRVETKLDRIDERITQLILEVRNSGKRRFDSE